MNDGEATLAVHPSAINRQYARIVKDCGPVQPHPSAVNRAGEGNLVGVEELKTRLVLDLLRQESEDVSYRV